MENLILKKISEDDIDSLQKLSQEIWNLHFPGIISNDQINYMLEEMYNTETIKKELINGIIWKIFYLNNDPIGYISYSMMEKNKCKLHKLYIHPDFHGKGLGKLGLDDVKNYAIKNNAIEILLNVHRDNIKAIKSYIKYGYKKVKKLDTVFGGFLLNDFLMKYEIIKK